MTLAFCLMEMDPEALKKAEDAFTAMPMETYCDAVFGKGNWSHDAESGLWLGKNPRHQGEGCGYIAVRHDKSWFTGIFPPEQRA